ncbi:hypothetical protein [Denitromonas ohlonensis]|uniref:Uncharacterized protein n=2 Tax=Denitromonas TaxID=139331 RepID=A0A557R5W0_9RHOO|nr:hypothetical protein [Denitromonas ohlonensis]TVO60542.1 hypothetical protein FHP90_17800 [Denitromonas ohlonensis]TVO72272.1 hypothetical protein FHP89_18500 [Denitromonas ohlonensis]
MNNNTKLYSYCRLCDIIADDGDNLSSKTATLSGLTRRDLDRRALAAKIGVQVASETGGKVPHPIRLDLWLINLEYTQRGIPPVFRNLPDLNDDDPAQVADLFAIDLAWLAARYPCHSPLFKRWQGVFKAASLLSTADYIAENHPRREPHWFCKGLALTDDQERELHIIKHDRHRRELDRLTDQREEVRIRLAAAYHGRDDRYKTDDHIATIARRVAVWFCGSLAGWKKPQRIADLLLAYTGDAISRQLAAKIVAQVHRDIPESKPRTRRSIRKI